MEAKISKKSYYLPEILMDIFKEWCRPGRDYSPKIAGAILHYMALDPATREFCEKQAYGKKESIIKAIDHLKLNDDDPAEIVPALIQKAERESMRANKKGHGA